MLSRQHAIPGTACVSAGNPHLESDSEATTTVATKAGDCLVVSIAMFPEVAEILACYTVNAHLLRVVA